MNALNTREEFEQQLSLEAAGRSTASLAVLRIGLDRFKLVNEAFGHAVGDEILRRSEERLHTVLRGEDALVRLPGDEFAIMITSASSALDPGVVASRLHDLLKRTFLVQGQVANITACIGVAQYPDHGIEAATLIQRSGMALRAAKAVGPGATQMFSMVHEQAVTRRNTLTRDLRKALILNQMEVHYQPQIDMRRQALIGFEALLRWRHPELGWIPPSDFIPLAEEAGLIPAIGDWVLRIACLQAAHLPEDIVIAVNVSPLQFRTDSLVRSVKRALGRAGISGRRLEIEITEGVLLKNERDVKAALEELHAMGVRLAMDDFGTGYSSLGQLAELPFDTIKLDRSLVGGGARQRAVVRAIATLGSGIGMSTLAEGIETKEQLTDACSDGCGAAQGYLFGKAVPAAKLHEVLASFSRAIPLGNTRIVSPLPFPETKPTTAA